MDVEKNITDYFKKFYGMKPYLFIDEEEWKHIMETYEKEIVVEELSKVLHTYPCPIPEISEEETLKPSMVEISDSITTSNSSFASRTISL